MNRQELQEAISNAFLNLSELNDNLYDYWITELYDDCEPVWDKWNESNLKKMEDDVMFNS